MVVGAPGTPTPRGHYFIVDHMRLYNNWAHGVHALATSAYSAKLKHFDGGDGVIALHGRGFLTAPVGTAASHGCIRFNDRDISWLAKRIQNGTRIDIQRCYGRTPAGEQPRDRRSDARARAGHQGDFPMQI